MIYKDEIGRTVKAQTYLQAAEKLYGQGKSIDGRPTTYFWNSFKTAYITVYKDGAKFGTEYGNEADTPTYHILKKVDMQSLDEPLDLDEGDKRFLVTGHVSKKNNFKTHELKIAPIYFEAVRSGRKTFEVRKDDRSYQENDVLILK